MFVGLCVGGEGAADEFGELRHAEVGGGGAGGEFVELGEFLLGVCQADGQAVDLAEPALLFGLGDAVVEVVAHFEQTVSLAWVGSQEWAAGRARECRGCCRRARRCRARLFGVRSGPGTRPIPRRWVCGIPRWGVGRGDAR